MTVTTAFSLAGSDGYLESYNANYGVARAGSGIVVSDIDTFIRVGQFIFGIYVVAEGFVAFNTASIPATDLVSAVVMEMFYITDQTAADFTLRVRTHPTGFSPLEEEAFVPGADISTTGTHVASRAANATGLGGYVTFIDVAWATNIQEGDITYAFLYSQEQENNSAPAGNEFVEYSSSDEAGTTQDPKLTITHASTVSRIPYTSRPFHVWRASNLAR